MKIKVHMKRKRETIDRDFCEAAFHGEFWSQCRLCGKAYESYSVLKENGKEYCPWCKGYGEEHNDE